MFNIVSYLLFLGITFYITFDVGRRCFNSGTVYLEYLIQDKCFCLTVNKILLRCYYLVNLGHIAISLSFWSRINSLEEMMVSVFTKIGTIVLILCALHFINLTALYFLRNKITLK